MTDSTVVVIAAVTLVLMASIAIVLALLESRKQYARYASLQHESETQAETIQAKITSAPSNSPKSVREFLYVDLEKLYSMYSQVFEGVNDKVVEERISQLIRGETAGLVLRQATAGSTSTDAYRRTESGFLYDHMYNRLEEHLQAVLIDANSVNPNDAYTAYVNNPMVKVTGISEIEDFVRMYEFLGKFNDVGRAIAYSIMRSDVERLNAENEITRQLAEPHPNVPRRQLQEQLDRLNDVETWARARGLHQDSQVLKNLQLFTEVFNPTGYNVLITPSGLNGIRYRGVLNKDFLRSDTDLLRITYGGESKIPWTMVGIVTFVPPQAGAIDAETSVDTEANQQGQDSNMFDSYREMFRNLRGVENMFLQSAAGLEISVSPLAIYREFQISKREA